MDLTYVISAVAVFSVSIAVVAMKLRKKSREIAARDFRFVALEIQIAKSTSRTEPQTAPLAAEHMFSSLHGLLRNDPSLQEHFTFEIVSNPNGIKFYSIVPEEITGFVESQIYAQYPTAQIKKVDDYVFDVTESGDYEIANILLSKEQFFPIKTYRDFEVDPLSSITSALNGVGANEHVWMQFLLKPEADVWQDEGHNYVEAVRTGIGLKRGNFLTDALSEIPKAFIKELGNLMMSILSFGFKPAGSEDYGGGGGDLIAKPDLSAGKELELKAIEEKLSKMGFRVQVRILSSSFSKSRAQSNLRSVCASMEQFSIANMNSFSVKYATDKRVAYENFKNRRFINKDSYVMNTTELASIFHLPTSVETPNIDWVFSKKSEPPSNLPTQNCTYIGETLFRDRKVKFGLSNETDDRVRHMYLIGKSGTGKSTLFLNMIIQDINLGYGVGVLDPHGELIEKVLDYIPKERVEDVILVDPSDLERPVGINLLEMQDTSQKNLMASGLVSAIKHHFDYSWGPRLEYLLNYSILTLLEVPGTSMLGITRLLTDQNYQNYILHFVKDPVVREFWDKEYKTMKGNTKLVTEAIAPIQNKINRFLSSTTIRNILGQKNSTIDFGGAMNDGKILLMNLSKGRIGEDNANLLGALLVSRLQFMAMQRVKIPEKQRKAFYLYVDEFQNFATGSFESILSESRKYKLGLYLTHQYTAQLPETLLSAVYGNVGTIASLAVGASDASVMATEFAPYFDENDLISLERFQMYLKLMIDGMTSHPFSARILLPWNPADAIVQEQPYKETVIQRSREKYGVDKGYVEEKIARWVEAQFDKGMAIAQEYKRQKEQEPDQNT